MHPDGLENWEGAAHVIFSVGIYLNSSKMRLLAGSGCSHVAVRYAN